MKTSELHGAALDWAIAKCEGLQTNAATHPLLENFFPSRLWSQGGPIIEREKINVSTSATAPWMAFIYDGLDMTWVMDGPTPLIAAMRCYVASKLGDDVEIPKELK